MVIVMPTLAPGKSSHQQQANPHDGQWHPMVFAQPELSLA
jgi:hypothetical protein